jgi:hypothetical protein
LIPNLSAHHFMYKQYVNKEIILISKQVGKDNPIW